MLRRKQRHQELLARITFDLPLDLTWPQAARCAGITRCRPRVADGASLFKTPVALPNAGCRVFFGAPGVCLRLRVQRLHEHAARSRISDAHRLASVIGLFVPALL